VMISFTDVLRSEFDNDFIIIDSSRRLLDTASHPRYVVQSVADAIRQEIDREILFDLLHASGNKDI